MLRPGQGLILIVVCLLMIGVVMITSAGLTIATAEPTTLAGVLLSRTALFAVLAIAILAVASRAPITAIYERRGLASPMPWIAIGAVALLLAVHVPGVGREVNGARRWIELGPIGFQPSELAKWGMIFVVAWYCTRRAGAMGRLTTGFLAPMTIVGVICALIATEDLGTAVLIGAVAVLMLVGGGAKIRHAALLLPVGIAGFVAAVFANPYRIDRLRAFLDPYQDPRGIGYHVLQSMSAVAGGGLPGRGLGNGVQKFGYLPEDTTDFIFAVICEELGVFGAGLVICLFAALLICGLSIVKRATTPFARLLGVGILLTIGLQALLNLLVVTGLAPTKGIALPLVSSGGTGWCLTALAVGVLVAIEREARAPRSAQSTPVAGAPIVCAT